METNASNPPPSPPKGPSTAAVWSVLVLLAAALGAGFLWGQHAHRGPADAASQPAAQYYTCGMHPWVILPHPGDCPICHMKLVPLDPAKFTGEVAISPAITQDIGVRLAQVVSGPVTRVIRTVGNVDYNETAVRDINTKVPGWIEKLYVDYTGEPVKKGQPLFELYSPELYSAQTDYLLALKNPAYSPQDTAGRNVLGAVRNRLEYFDISPDQIAALEKSGKPSKTMTISSPFDGLVVEKNVIEGQRVEAGARLYRIADLSSVWVMATLYEYQLPYVQVGQKAVMTLPYIPGQTFEGKVTYIYPYLNAELRQVKVRLEFPNPTGLLKPGMYANIELHSTLAADRTLVPREAVIDTGKRQVAFVSLGQGRFEPREVTLGVEAQNGMVEVLRGLKKGEMVVTSAQFLLDSESRLRESLAKMLVPSPASQTASAAPAPAAGGKGKPASLPPEAQQALAALVDDYLQIATVLAGDQTQGIDAMGRRIAAQVDELLKVQVPGNEHFWHEHDEVAVIRAKALALAGGGDIAQARLALADLSIALGQLLRATGVPVAAGEIQELHCPMYREGQGGSVWLQRGGEEVRNPYFGATMLGCFDKRYSLPATK